MAVVIRGRKNGYMPSRHMQRLDLRSDMVLVPLSVSKPSHAV